LGWVRGWLGIRNSVVAPFGGCGGLLPGAAPCHDSLRAPSLRKLPSPVMPITGHARRSTTDRRTLGQNSGLQPVKPNVTYGTGAFW